MKEESSNFSCTALDKGPIASATPMSRNARKMGTVLSFMELVAGARVTQREDET